MDKTVYILGAGFSKGVNAPLQSEILDEIFKIDEEELLPNVRKIFVQYRNEFRNFLSHIIFIEQNDFGKISLEDIYTPIDRCISDNMSFRNVPTNQLTELRQKINGLIIIMLDHKLRMERGRGGYINRFTKFLISKKQLLKSNDPFSIISINWDILLDNSFHRNMDSSKGIIDYCCHTTPYNRGEPLMPALIAKGKGLYNFKILKLHGSTNWLYCKRCQRLFVTFFEKIAVEEFVSRPICRFCERNFENEDSNSSALLSSQLIMPTFLKDLNNVQIKLIWHNAGNELSEASKVVFIGYSFPMADFELRQLLIRNTRHNAEIEVVLHSSDKPKFKEDASSAEYRYKSFFGKRKMKFFYDGVANYVNRLVN